MFETLKNNPKLQEQLMDNTTVLHNDMKASFLKLVQENMRLPEDERIPAELIIASMVQATSEWMGKCLSFVDLYNREILREAGISNMDRYASLHGALGMMAQKMMETSPEELAEMVKKAKEAGVMQ